MGVERFIRNFKGCRLHVLYCTHHMGVSIQTLLDDRVLILLNNFASFVNFSNARDGSRKTASVGNRIAAVGRNFRRRSAFNCKGLHFWPFTGITWAQRDLAFQYFITTDAVQYFAPHVGYIPAIRECFLKQCCDRHP